MVSEFSVVLAASRHGDAAAWSQAFEAAYDELRRLARGQLRRLRPGQTLTTTAARPRGVRQARGDPVPEDRVHFFALAARAMRQILVDYARQRGARKRGGDRRSRPSTASRPVETLADEMLAIDRA